jgi:DNA-binding response OmpR family regulator
MPDNKKPPKSDPKTKRILVVDDEEAIRDMVKMLLDTEGFSVQTARDGRNILEVSKKFRPDLIVSDMMMPGGGGYELLRSLQSDEDTRSTPVFVMTGRDFDSSTKDMMKQEPNVKGFFDKPIRQANFLNDVHALLNTKSKAEMMLEKQKEQDKKLPGGDINLDRYGF